MCDMEVTLLTIHADRSLLKEEAPLNMYFMVVTLLTIHADRSLLKEEAS